ncbi:MAG: hypothetical protein GX657_13770 [Chloroflexi bacterium]|nr:hypothetical protein [Chloroflexota bacterium]
MSELSRLHTLYANASLFDGRYRLGEGRWEGAVGVVREAYDISAHDLRVVIKHPDPYLGPEVRAYKERLLDLEAEALQRLDAHPQVCRMLGQGRVGSGPGGYRYLVIEWADGEPVSALLQEAAQQGGSLPIGTVLTILIQLARVLAEAHRQGLINNDVDVKHLYWNQSARNLKMIDWGNAKLVSGAEAGPFTLRDDVIQFADVMYCLLTGRHALDAAQADLAFWQAALSEVHPVVRDDLALIGSRASRLEGGYRQAIELHRDLEACMGRFRTYLSGPLAEVDALLQEAGPESLARAEERLQEIAKIAPVDEGLLQRVARLEAIRRERREAAAMQLGSAYVKAGSWLDAVEVLSRTFGYQVDPRSAPGLLLAAARLVDSRRSAVAQETAAAWASAARALVEKQQDRALEAYLSVPESALDTAVEPVRSLLELSGRYVLRHEVRVILRALADLREQWRKEAGGDGNSHTAEIKAQTALLGRAHRELRLALTALNACQANDWAQQDASYRRLAAALESCLGLPGLPSPVAARLGGCAEQARALVRRCDDIEAALAAERFEAAAELLAAVPRSDPENTSAARQGERLPRLGAVFQRIHRFDGWTASSWEQLEEGVLADVEGAFSALPGSSLKTRTLEQARECLQQQAALREAEHLAEGLRLFEQGDWRAARAWAVRVRREHSDWEPGQYVVPLADGYAALFDADELPRQAIARADEALRRLEPLAPQHEALRTLKKRLEAMLECCEHLTAGDEPQQQLALIVVQNLPTDDAYRERLLRGIEVTRQMRVAVRGGQWSEALQAVDALAAAGMPVLAGVAGRWRSVFGQLAEAERLRDEARYPEALACLEQALLLMPPVELGRPAPTVRAIEEGIQAARERLSEEWAEYQDTPAPPRPAEEHHPDAAAPSGTSRLRALRTELGATGLAGRLRSQALPAGRQMARGAGAWLSRTADRIAATLEARPTTPRRARGARQPARKRQPQAAVLVEEDEPADTAPAEEAPARPAGRQVDVLGWAIGGAAVVGVLALVLALSLARNDSQTRAANGAARSAEAALAAARELIAAGDDDAATARLAELQARQGGSLPAEQQAELESLADCLWLRAQGTAVAPEGFREDLEHLAALWQRALARGAEGLEALCPAEGGAQAAVAAAAQARYAYLQAVLAQGGPGAYEGVLATLDGLGLADLGTLLGDAAAFRTLEVEAEAGLAAHWFAAGDCDLAGQALVRLSTLTEGNSALAEAVGLGALTAQGQGCAAAQAACQALAGLASRAPEHPGEELLVLAEAAGAADALARACPGVSLDALVSSRLAALLRLARQGDPAEAIAQAMQVAGHPWFAHPPLKGSASPAEVAAEAYAALLASRCSEGSCADGPPAEALAEAEAFYGAQRGSLGEGALKVLVGALRAAGSTCANCSLPAAAETAALDLLDPDLGDWSAHGVYFSGTASGLVWHLNDVFVKKQREPDVMVPVDGGGASQPLYTTSLAPTDGEPLGIQSIRLDAKVVTLQGPADDWRALWGLQVPGSDDDPVYLLTLWQQTAEGGQWALLTWQPGSGPPRMLPLPDGPLDQVVHLGVERGLDGASYDLFWQGDLVIAGQALPGPLDRAQLRLLVGAGTHAWIQTAGALVVR